MIYLSRFTLIKHRNELKTQVVPRTSCLCHKKRGGKGDEVGGGGAGREAGTKELIWGGKYTGQRGKKRARNGIPGDFQNSEHLHNSLQKKKHKRR